MLDNIEQLIKQYEPKPLGKQRQYAVLLPLVEVDGEYHILYEVRSHLISQPGETSFPGGAVEKGETFEEAAVRETTEELTISSDRIQVLGEIDYVSTQTHVICCFVGTISDFNQTEMKPNEEVEKIFTIPLSFFRENQPEYHSVSLKTVQTDDFPFDLISKGKKYDWGPRKHTIPFYRLTENYLWGYTANLTYRFLEIITDTENKTDTSS